MENISVPRPQPDARSELLQALSMKVRAGLMTLGFAAPCVTVALHDNADIDPLVDKAGPVCVVGVGCAAPLDLVMNALANNPPQEK